MCDTKVEALEYRYRMLEPVEDFDGVHLCSLADNAAMKLSALISRGSKKDMVDIAATLKEVSLDQLLEWVVEKFPNSEPFMAIKSLTWFGDTEEEPDPVFLNDQTWQGVKSEILSAVR